MLESHYSGRKCEIRTLIASHAQHLLVPEQSARQWDQLAFHHLGPQSTACTEIAFPTLFASSHRLIQKKVEVS